MEDLDFKILKQASKGDKKAFKLVYDHYGPFTWRLLLRMTGNEELARELLQETFVRVHFALHKFKGESAFSTWVYKIAHNTVLMNYRKIRLDKKHDQYEDLIAGSYKADGYINRQIVSRILSELTLEERFLLITREVDGMTFEEISQICGVAAGTLRTRLHRLKEDIRCRFSEPEIKKEIAV